MDKHGPDGFHSQTGENLGPCWLWTGGLTGADYGIFSCEPLKANGRLTSKGSHCYAYELLAGPIPKGLLLDHLCRVTICVNPHHLETVTIQENFRRGAPSVSAINRAKTHCVHGHPLTGDNVWINPKTGGRVCRTCSRRLAQESRDRKRANQSKEEAAFSRTGPECTP